MKQNLEGGAARRALTYRAAVRRFEQRVLWTLGFFNVVLLGGTTGYRLTALRGFVGR